MQRPKFAKCQKYFVMSVACDGKDLLHIPHNVPYLGPYEIQKYC